MIRKVLFLAGAVILLLMPERLIAGGPPWLCLPIAGVTPDNAQECVDLISAKLESKLWQHDGPYRDVRVDRHRDQWFLTFHIGEDVRLSDVRAAFKGSVFSIPRDKLRLFGHVILEIDAGAAPRKALLADLDTLEYVSVAKLDNKEGLQHVTVQMPYPATEGRPQRGFVGWETFRRNDFSSEPSTKPEPSTTSQKLPSYDVFHDIVAKHHASLRDLRWSTIYACRPLGGVVVPESGGGNRSKVAQAIVSQ